MMRFVILVVAIVAGGGAAWLAVWARAPAPPPLIEPAAVASVPLQDVLVAATDLQSGHALTAQDLTWQAWPPGDLNSALETRQRSPEAIQQLSGSIVRGGFVAHEPIRRDKLGAPNSGMLSTRLAPGKRAVAVHITAENTAGGFILPNDRVDVLDTMAEPTATGDKLHVTRTILRNVGVLAIDQAVELAENGSRVPNSALGKTATLELDSAQAEIIAAAEATGLLSLALRPASDNAEPVTARAPYATVRIIRGGRMETVRLAPARPGAPVTTPQITGRTGS